MANPAPTINQINAFNATQGTTIDFNIIGGTELVRSNRIYIYDLSDNSLICTHLYASTESIHELPPNTDGSIVYESGKSSADFVNGAQYYAQIQTFTDIGGTEGGSGLSVAKMFWCLVDPTLTITTIPSTISTTSYNVSATYNANTSVVSNIIQQYQFSLYSATGSLLQSSGVVVGSGEQQGTSTAYDISYNFTGLSVGSSYYVTVEVTTTQGMNVTTQSNTFTVSIDTPTLGEATVVNNACDGYISVTSNLSGEYGGSASGEIATFETDSVNDVSSLKVTLTPQQDLHGYDKPWVGGAGKNKLPVSCESTTKSGVTYTVYKNNSGAVTRIHAEGTSTSAHSFTVIEGHSASNPFRIKAGSYWFKGISNGVSASFDMNLRKVGETSDIVQIKSKAPLVLAEDTDFQLCYLYVYNGKTINTDIYPMIWLQSESSDDFEPYSNICPISGWDSVETNVTGVNVWDEEWELGDLNTTNGQNYPATNRIRSKNYIRVLPNTTYYFKSPYNSIVCFYDANKNFVNIGNATLTANATFTTQSNVHYMRISPSASYGTTYKNDISINYPSTDTEYHAYQGTTYTTDLPQTVYGGTLDVVSGVLTVDRAMVTLNTANMGNSEEFPGWRSSGIRSLMGSGLNNIFNDVQTNVGRGIGVNTIRSSDTLMLLTGQYGLTQSEWKSLSMDVQMIIPLATPQTYQLTPKQIQTLVGQNNVWSDAGDVDVTFNLPISNLLVKRQDASDVSGNWLTLYSQPITQASDMDFTFIDFLNQYGKTYKYALVPLLTQTQSGVEVEVEGGYTVSDEVQSIFDGVFIADSTGSQKCKANVGYGNVDMNQTVGTITPIGAKYPVVITNSKNQYHNGSISGTIVPDDYYFNGNLSRIDMVNKRNELEQFLTNKRAKIIKDWNGNIWLAMIMDNVSCTFNNNYGMGIVNFSTNWIEVGDPTNQQDLQATGLIDVGGA